MKPNIESLFQRLNPICNALVHGEGDKCHFTKPLPLNTLEPADVYQAINWMKPNPNKCSINQTLECLWQTFTTPGLIIYRGLLGENLVSALTIVMDGTELRVNVDTENNGKHAFNVHQINRAMKAYLCHMLGGSILDFKVKDYLERSWKLEYANHKYQFTYI